jgi:flagellar biosynthesis anti-sigma factor FlgM
MMKINDTGTPAPPIPAQSRVFNATERRAVVRLPQHQAPATEVTPMARSGDASASLAPSPFDAKKVAEIKASISAGIFRIAPEKIADGLMASVISMLETKL